MVHNYSSTKKGAINVSKKACSKKPGSIRPLKTLERVFSKRGIGSRTDARSWIGNGKVRVNGRIVKNPDQWVDLERDRITLDGKAAADRGQTLHPVIQAQGISDPLTGDPEGRPTVYDLVADAGAWLSPVGRLDLDTSGLLIMTNDTAFAERVDEPPNTRWRRRIG